MPLHLHQRDDAYFLRSPKGLTAVDPLTGAPTITMPKPIMRYFLADHGFAAVHQTKLKATRELPQGWMIFVNDLLKEHSHCPEHKLHLVLPRLLSRVTVRHPAISIATIKEKMEDSFFLAATMNIQDWEESSYSVLLQDWALVMKAGHLLQSQRPSTSSRAFRPEQPEWFIRWQKLCWQIEEVISAHLHRMKPVTVLGSDLATFTFTEESKRTMFEFLARNDADRLSTVLQSEIDRLVLSQRFDSASEPTSTTTVNPMIPFRPPRGWTQRLLRRQGRGGGRGQRSGSGPGRQ